MAKTTRHGGPSHNHYDWVPIVRPQLGAIDRCHGDSSITSTPNTLRTSELIDPLQESPANMMVNPLPSPEASENVDSVEESTALPESEPEPIKKRRTTKTRKISDDFDF